MLAGEPVQDEVAELIRQRPHPLVGSGSLGNGLSPGSSRPISHRPGPPIGVKPKWSTEWGQAQMVGMRGFEPRTSCSQSRRAAKLRHIPLNLPLTCQFPATRVWGLIAHVP
jgi:hypothetical protein